jgi:hypothetical protein
MVIFIEYATSMSCEKLKGNSSLWMDDFCSVHDAFYITLTKKDLEEALVTWP